MQRTRLLIIGGAAVLVVVLFLVLRPGGSDDDAATPVTTAAHTTAPPPPPAAPKPTVIRIDIKGGKPTGGIARATVKKGGQVRLVVTSDVEDEVHVHGYDLMQDVGPGERVVLEFRATVPGGFEIELEDRDLQIAELGVEP